MLRVSTPALPRSEPAPSRESSDDVIEGPRWYRHRIRVWGHWLALVVPGVVGAIAWISLRLFDSAWSGAVGLIGAVFAAPALLFVGAPFGERSSYPYAVLVSAALWMLVGFIAARRATKNPTADWSDFWRHYFVMLTGIWLGAGIALAVAGVSVGRDLIDW